jgi:hypothetical protein
MKGKSMKKIISMVMPLFTIFSIQQNFPINKEQALEECIAMCEKDINDFTKDNQHECKEGFFNRLKCIKNGVQAIRKFDACTNKCLKTFDTTIDK